MLEKFKLGHYRNFGTKIEQPLLRGKPLFVSLVPC
jgi:hypothetical protein